MRLKPQLVGILIGLAAVLPIVLCVTPGENLARMSFGFMIGSLGAQGGAVIALLVTARGKSRRGSDAP